MTTPAKLFGRELSSYDEVDVDELLAKLTQEELNMLAKEVDPDVSNFFIFILFKYKSIQIRTVLVYDFINLMLCYSQNFM